jgi:hypothetical protein
LFGAPAFQVAPNRIFAGRQMMKEGQMGINIIDSRRKILLSQGVEKVFGNCIQRKCNDKWIRHKLDHLTDEHSKGF